MPKMIFVNLPVADVAKSTAFYEAIGFEKNPQFSNEQASCMVWSDTIHVMLLSHEFYAHLSRPSRSPTPTRSAPRCSACRATAAPRSITISEPRWPPAAAKSTGRRITASCTARAFEDLDGHASRRCTWTWRPPRQRWARPNRHDPQHRYRCRRVCCDVPDLDRPDCLTGTRYARPARHHRLRLGARIRARPRPRPARALGARGSRPALRRRLAEGRRGKAADTAQCQPFGQVPDAIATAQSRCSNRARSCCTSPNAPAACSPPTPPPASARSNGCVAALNSVEPSSWRSRSTTCSRPTSDGRRRARVKVRSRI